MQADNYQIWATFRLLGIGLGQTLCVADSDKCLCTKYTGTENLVHAEFFYGLKSMLMAFTRAAVNAVC